MWTMRISKYQPIIQRNYPGEFTRRIWKGTLKYPPNLLERDDRGLTEHQATHINTSTKTITMIFTSAKVIKDPNIHTKANHFNTSRVTHSKIAIKPKLPHGKTFTNERSKNLK